MIELDQANGHQIIDLLKDLVDTSAGNEDKHYSGEIQAIHLIVSQNLGALEANIVKYVSRHQKKGGIEDLKKAQFYLNVLIRLYEAGILKKDVP